MRVYPTLVELIETAVQHFRKRTFIKVPRPDGSGAEEASFSELGTWSATLAGALQAREFAPGDKVAVIAKPRLEWIIAFYGVLRAGGVVVPIDASLRPEEVERLLAATEANWVLASGDWVNHLNGLAGLRERVPSLRQLVTFDHAPAEGALTFGELLVEDGPFKPVPRKPSDLALLMCTSGTTGDAKAVMLSHENLSSNTINALQIVDITGQDRVLEIAPWNHIFGVLILLVGTHVGARIVYTDDYRNLNGIMADERITVLVGVPKLFHGMFDKIESTVKANPVKRSMYNLSPKLVGRKLKEQLGGELRFFVSGSAPLDPKVMQGFRRLGIGVIEGYGMTETAPTLTASTAFNDKFGSVGVPIPSVELKVADPDEEGIGEVVARGPNVTKGYFNNPERTRETIDEDGWLHTGDLGYLDADGWLFLKGRKKNVIVLESGKNVYPEEVEFELEQIPEIGEVMVCGGKRKGIEVVKVLVYPDRELLGDKKAPAEVKELIWQAVRRRSQNLAPFKRPKSEHDLILVDAPFEKTSTLDIKRYLYQSEHDDG